MLPLRTEAVPSCVRCLLLTVLAIVVVSGSAVSAGVLEFYNGFDPSKPTVIAAHGLNGTIEFDDTFGRSPSYVDKANVVGWEWDADLTSQFIVRARESGQQLAWEFAAFIASDAPDYMMPIQLVGHSLGTHVVLSAASELRELALIDSMIMMIQPAQVTLVDTGFNGTIQLEINDVLNNALLPVKMDNYWSPRLAAGTGKTYAGELANARVPIDHLSIWRWYFASLDTPPLGIIKAGGQYSVVGQYSHLDFGSVAVEMIAGKGTPTNPGDDRFKLVSW
ncbi:hypothetical protein Mal4_03200 [Maioricimonas rarisocia]|uniref:Alpha/beta hydrolase family protein n=1 Tax=Maioricimonas rarisocia TaxID=2528026 RepID=A0A517Z0N5_9PLAN|nr:hypothetical protein [Maioricimonas rarisocia]QDU36037.1 hypothetical protein Mal4_03200 [Maioricimonas rarisocia]